MAVSPHGATSGSSSGAAQPDDRLSAPLFHSLVDRLGDGGRAAVLSDRGAGSDRSPESAGLSVPPFLLISNIVTPRSGEVI